MGRILIIEDQRSLVESLKKLLAQEGHSVETAAKGEAGLEKVAVKPPDLVLLDLMLPGIKGMDVLAGIQKVDSRIPVVIMTGFGTTETAIEAIKHGAFDYVPKPFEFPDMLKIVEKALEAGEKMKSQVMLGPEPSPAHEAIVGVSSVMQEVYKTIGKVAPTDATVLIRGDTGTGKELVARAIYHHSARANKPFFVVNCVAIPETLLESELFGYERGAFTGADRRKIGKFEQAGGATIFLDEIGEMPPSTQAKLTRLLQEKTIERLGGQETIEVDVRIIAATNRDLENAMKEARFRDDLYYRLNVVTITIPPLRARPEDIPLLSKYFAQRYGREMGYENVTLSDEAIDLLKTHTWPGNVRELENAIRKALILGRGYPIGPEDLLPSLKKKTDSDDLEETVNRSIAEYLASTEGSNLHERFMQMVDKVLVSEALRITGGNQTKAAKLLGLTRPTLQAKMDKHKLKKQVSITEK
jgi:DNA-binding NtrC family response regulator